MQNLVCRSSLFAAALLMCSNFAAAQMLSQAPLVSSAPGAAMYPTPEFKWDYRFDAQYNSTIKPYLRWHNRQGNKAPASGVRYPYYLGPQPYYGGGNGVGGCNACGQTGQASGYVQPHRSSWFNPYQHLNQARSAFGQPSAVRGDHHGILPYVSQHSPEKAGAASASPAVETKVAWVKLEATINSASILYSEPAKAASGEFVQANVTTTNGKLSSIDWIDQPSDQLTTVLAKYIK